MSKYEELDRFLVEGRTQPRKKWKNETWIERRDDGSLDVELFGKRIMKFHEDGTIVLDSCGWRTRTTKDRFGEFLPRSWTVYQRRGVWYLNYGYYNSDEHQTYVFEDGITIHPDGSVTGDGADPKATEKLARQAAKYARDFVDALLAGEVPCPSGADCWYCGMHTTGGRSLGDSFGDKDHLVSHIEEKYYVPSLLVNAIEEFGVSKVTRHVIGYIWSGDYGAEDIEREYGYWFDVVRRQAGSSIRRYMRRRLGLPG